MSGGRRLIVGLVLVPLAGCAGLHDNPFLAPFATGEPDAAPDEAAVTENTALQIMSSVIVGDLLVGGDAAARMLQPVVPAAGASDRQRQPPQAVLLERWMSSRVEATPSTPADIRRAQQLLADLGYEPGPIDGLMGPRTRAAVERFQTRQGLPVSGEVTPALLDSLAAEQS